MKIPHRFLNKTLAAIFGLVALSVINNHAADPSPEDGTGQRWSPSLNDKPMAAKPSFWMVRDGQPAATIILGKDALESNREAAALLQESIEKISGAKLPIKEDSDSVSGPKILIGDSPALRALNLDVPRGFTTDLKEEGYLIKQIGDVLVLAGNDHRPAPAYEGSKFAVIEILQRLGVRWFFPGEFGEVVPHSREVSLPLLDELVRPSFPVRGFWWGAARALRKDKTLTKHMDQWQTRNRFLPYGSVLPSAGDGSIMRAFEDWETREVDGEKVRVNKTFEQHPEYFALNADGTRNPDYLNLTEPEVLEVITRYVDTYFVKNPEALAFPLAPPDGAPTSEDPASRALNKNFLQKDPSDPKIQDISGSFYWFMNELAKRVEKSHPGKFVTTTAYSGRIRPPEGIEFCDNVTVHTALLAHSRHHRYDGKTWQTKERVQLYKRWNRLLDKVVERPYYPVFQFNCQIPQLMYRAEVFNIRLIQELGMRGKEWEGRTSFFSEGVNNYIRGQMLWNTETDADALLQDYYTRFYGPAGSTVQKFDEALETALTESMVDHHEEERIHEIFPHDFVVELTDKVGNVEGLVAESDPEFKSHVGFFRKMVDHFRAYSDMRQAESELDFALAAQKAQEMIDIETAVHAVEPTMIDSHLEAADTKPVYGELGANASAHGKLKQYLAKQKLLDGTEGVLVAALPETWKFKKDPRNSGVYFEWHSEDIESSWQDIKTTSSWEIQGNQDEEAQGYDGFAWYRTSFEVPEKFSGKKMILFIGGMNNQAWIWVNGALAAAVPYHEYWARWKYHAEVDISKFVRPGTQNEIAIRIWNDQNAGGIFRRSFIYSPVSPKEKKP